MEKTTALLFSGIQSGGKTILSATRFLNRSFIKVFYSTKREADNDSYNDIGQINKITGQIHPFEGLRGDAKALYKDIRTGKESRVRLISIKQGNSYHHYHHHPRHLISSSS